MISCRLAGRLSHDNSSIYLVSKIRHIQWQDDDEVVLILGIVGARMALNTITYRTVQRNDMKYIAVPVQDIHVSSGAKSQLEFLKCEFGMNVSYPINGVTKRNVGTKTHRSMLFPASLLLFDLPDLSNAKYWSMADFLNPHKPIFIEGSKSWLELIGVEELKGDIRSRLEEQMSAAEVRRTMALVLSHITLRAYCWHSAHPERHGALGG